MIRRISFLLSALVLGVVLLGQAHSAKAYVYENTHLATCSSFGFWGTTNAPYVAVSVYNAQTDTSLFLNTFPTTNGTVSVDVDFAPQPNGSILYYYVWGTHSTDPMDHDGEYQFELNDGYPCSESQTEPLYASTTSRTNACAYFAATGLSNAPYIGVEVKSATGTVLYRGKLPTSVGTFAFNVSFAKQKTGKVLEYRVWPSTTPNVTAYDGSYGYYARVACSS